jgi:hypothetical protein
MREEGLIVRLCERFGGTVTRKEGRRSNHSPSFLWRVTGANALLFAEEVGPAMFAKRRHAELIVRFQTLKGKFRAGNGYLSDETYAQYEKFWLEMSSLNERGIGKPNETYERKAP